LNVLRMAAAYKDIFALLEHYPVNVCLIAAAMRRLELVSVFVAPSLVTRYTGEYRKLNWKEGTHPPTIIFNAMVLSRVRLDQFEMGIPGWGKVRRSRYKVSVKVIVYGMPHERYSSSMASNTADMPLLVYMNAN
jgi:hypothetical protein